MLAACSGGGGGGAAAFGVGGTIRLTVVNALPGGLPAGLVLSDGRESLDIAVGASAFTFPTALPAGTRYAVSATQNPPGLECTASNGSGTIGHGAVNDVIINCGDASFTIGGAVRGLGAAGLILADNGGDLLPVAQSSMSFVFSAGVPFGSAYAVAVQTQPDGQSCAVSDGSGIVGSAPVSSVVVTCLNSVSPQSATVAAGATLQFHATVAAGSAVTWAVNGIPGGNAALGMISVAGMYTAPLTAGSFRISAIPTGGSSALAPASLVVLAPHAIAVRSTPSGIAELFDQTTGNTFTARGNNYIRLATQTDFGGNSTVYHSTFNAGLYDPVRTEAAFAGMQSLGYNTVRVFLNGCCQGSIGDSVGGLSAAYMANVADFLSRARKHAIFVIFTQDSLPSQGGYEVSCPPAPGAPQFEAVNALNLCAGAVAAASRFHRDFVQSLVNLQAPISAVLAYELRNEYYYSSDAGPFTSAGGLITAANGATYDMASAAARRQMMDDGLVYFTNQLRAAIVAVDPTALVTVGFFWPQSPNPTRIGDARVISVYPAIAGSTADFVDIHGYVISGDLTLEQLMQNYGLVGHQQTQPVIMGEFGAFMNAAPTIGDAATLLENWQQGGCGYGLKGWLLWTWDTEEAAAGAVWNATAGDGSINRALAPGYRPDPCSH